MTDNKLEAVDESTVVVVEPMPVKDEEVTYTLMEGSSQRGNNKLIDNRGYTYAKQSSNGDRTFWRCSVRNRLVRCMATVSQQGSIFTPGVHPHCHEPKGGYIEKMQLHKRIKQCAKQWSSLSGTAIVHAVISESSPVLSVTKQEMNCLIRLANREVSRVRKLRGLKEQQCLGIGDVVQSEGTSATSQHASEGNQTKPHKGGRRRRLIISPGNFSKSFSQLGTPKDSPAVTQSAETLRDILHSVRELVTVSRYRAEIEEQRLRIESRRLEIEEERRIICSDNQDQTNMGWQVIGENEENHQSDS